MTEQTKIVPIDGPRAYGSLGLALAAAQAEMGRAKKTAKNPHFKSKYADLDAVCDAALPALNRHGIAVVQPLERIGDEWVQVTRFIHGDSGETMETPVPLIMGKMDMQGLGSAMTYARRYGLMALAGIAPEDDDGNAAVENTRRVDVFDARTVADRIITALRKADSLDALSKVWGNAREDLGKIKAQNPEAYAQCEAEKDTRKAAMTPPPDLGDDELPY